MPIFPRSVNRIHSPFPILSREARRLPFSGRHYSSQSSRPQMANMFGNPQDFFRYTRERPYNKTFKLTTGNGKAVVARVPNPNAGPAFLTTVSEVVTIDFDTVTIQHKLLSLEFSEYGCLFYRKDASPGPMVGTTFRSKGRGDMDIDRGSYILGSFLWHSDLHTPNIFVDETGRHPHFLDYNGDLILQLPESFKQLDDDTQTATYTAERNPNLTRVFQYANSKTMTDPIRCVVNTWDGDILPLQGSLIRVQKKWDLLGHPGKCLINFSPEEIRKHHEDGEGWNEVQDVWDAVSGTMSRDGWTSIATYDQAISIFSQIQAKAPRSSNDV
ncbi:hypothetical protein BDW59DRAFT_173380 [Aspergillus cavernicola]|uniref:Uncharacterized protein n=1 Tax=Aspergillus cavernicola TaxID=176166 RepID=A0ABR4I738_9EURO